ncbi:hypothetical protein KAR91_57300 [Candidatus Pacearchaeota archaeon]|nr:hypothetical protein [Candidatus Pacearchaeota archaeon]
MKKVHYLRVNNRPECGRNRYEVLVSSSPTDVTCKNCLKAMIGRASYKRLEFYAAVAIATTAQNTLNKLSP